MGYADSDNDPDETQENADARSLSERLLDIFTENDRDFHFRKVRRGYSQAVDTRHLFTLCRCAKVCRCLHLPSLPSTPRCCMRYYLNGFLVGEPVASGLYFYTLTAGEYTATRRMLIRK